MIVYSIAKDFSRTPGSRYIREGRFSGEEFRTRHLTHLIRQARGVGTGVHLDLDGTAGYGTSFLEEVFGGLVRDDGMSYDVLKSMLRITSNDEPYLVEDIWGYINDAQHHVDITLDSHKG